MRFALLFAVAGLSGCWLSDGEIEAVLYGEDPGSDTLPLGDITLVALEPQTGPITGGLQVDVLVEGDVSQSPEVRFGGELAELVGVSDGVIRVVSPPGNQGFVDVSVNDQGRVAQLPNGFQYFPNRAGFTSIIGEVWWRDEIGPRADGVSEGRAWVMPIQPVPSSYRDMLYGVDALDTCVLSPDVSLFPQNLNLSQIPLVRVDNGATYDLFYRFQVKDYAATLHSGDYIGGARYDLGPFEGADWPVTLVSDAVELPTPLTVTSPVLTDYWSLADGDVIRWSHSAEERGDFVLLHIETSSIFGAGEAIDCVVHDDGEFQFSNALFDYWYLNTSVRLQVGRVKVVEGLIAFDGASTQIAGIYWASSVGMVSGF